MTRFTVSRSRGFTLIELIVSIVVSAIVVLFMTMFISGPIDIYMAQARRAELVDGADNLWLNMSRDLANTVPNSVRYVSNGTVVVLEMLEVADWGRYHPDLSMGNGSLELKIGSSDQGFGIAASQSTMPAASKATTVLNDLLANPYQLTSVTKNSLPPTFLPPVPDPSGEYQVNLGSAFTFGAASTTSRVYFIANPITYLCDTNAKTVTRFIGYSIATNQSSRNTAAKLTGAGASSALVATNVSNCSFTRPNGGQIISVDMTFTKAVSSGAETMRMFHQLFLPNLP